MATTALPLSSAAESNMLGSDCGRATSTGHMSYPDGRLSSSTNLPDIDVLTTDPPDDHSVTTFGCADSSVLDLSLELLSLQAERVKQYRHFEDAFSAYLVGASSFADFQTTVAQATRSFVDISNHIRRIESVLRNRQPDGPTLAGLIRDLQNLEKQKLKAITQFQIYALESVHGILDLEEVVTQSQLRIDKIVNDINEKMTEIHCEMASL